MSTPANRVAREFHRTKLARANSVIRVRARKEILQLIEEELSQAFRRFGSWSSSITPASGGTMFITTGASQRDAVPILREQMSYDYSGEGVEFVLYDKDMKPVRL